MTATSLSNWLPLRAWAVLALLGALAGCATTQSGAGGMNQLQTASDETEVRKRARTRLMLASSYFENGQTTIALDEMKKALQIDPSLGDTYNLGGLIYMTMGDKALAQSHFERAISLNPRDADAMHNFGVLQCQQGRYAAAKQLFERAMAVPTYMNRAKTLKMQGICEARSGDAAAAEATLMHSYELDAGDPVTGYNLSSLLYRRGDYTKAQFYIRRLNNSELANAQSLWLGIRVEHRLGNRQAMDQLGAQLRRRFAQSPELTAYEQGTFDE
ncbi:MAG: type IV pilus biogenesis/stability protein PilW [Desulfovibrionaceae bacterium]|nr:type IV pilus biogenesis/stability protein PilW [Desulfovibrionaceae bacterium]